MAEMQGIENKGMIKQQSIEDVIEKGYRLIKEGAIDKI